tara:strand:+ start:502 stop:864 length:363 start_codon:yes stop_codon:yes gene_type:complete
MKFLVENWRLYLAIALTLSFPIAMISLYEQKPLDMSTGEGVYRTHCARCHGIDGRGNGVAADFVGDVQRMSKSDEELLKSIEEGMYGRIGFMPAWKNIITDEQIRLSLEYIRENFHPGGI